MTNIIKTSHKRWMGSVMGLVTGAVIACTPVSAFGYTIKSEPISLKGFTVRTEATTEFKVNGERFVQVMEDESHYRISKQPHGYSVLCETLSNRVLVDGVEQKDPFHELMGRSKLSYLLDNDGKAIAVTGLDEVYEAALKQFGQEKMDGMGVTREDLVNEALGIWGKTFGLYVGNNLEPESSYELSFNVDTPNGLSVPFKGYLIVRTIEKAFNRDALRMYIDTEIDEESFTSTLKESMKAAGYEDVELDTKGSQGYGELLLDLTNGLAYEYKEGYEFGFKLRVDGETVTTEMKAETKMKVTGID